jgi:hypothetical protein
MYSQQVNWRLSTGYLIIYPYTEPMVITKLILRATLAPKKTNIDIDNLTGTRNFY